MLLVAVEVPATTEEGRREPEACVVCSATVRVPV